MLLCSMCLVLIQNCLLKIYVHYKVQILIWFPPGSAGLLIAVQREYFNILNYKELHFNDFGDRVAQLLHVELASPISQWRNSNIRQEILIVNTHLLFPHDSTLSLVRLQQVPKHLNVTSNLNHMPII